MLNAGRRVAILGGARLRSPRSNTAYVDASNEEMLRAALQAIVAGLILAASGSARWWPAPCSGTAAIST